MRYSDIHASEERIAGSLGRKRKRSKRTERRKLEARPRTAETFHDHDRADIRSSVKRYSDREGSVTDKSRRRKRRVSRGKKRMSFKRYSYYKKLKKFIPRFPFSYYNLFKIFRLISREFQF